MAESKFFNGVPESYHLLIGEVNDESCKLAIEWILDANFKQEPLDVLNLLICSSGGDVSPAFALIDVIRGSRIPVNTIGVGEIASSGLMVFMAGNYRTLTSNTSVMTHNFNAESSGPHNELVAQMKDFNMTYKKMLAHYKKCTGQSEAIIREYLITKTDVYLSPKEALRYNICDKVSILS